MKDIRIGLLQRHRASRFRRWEEDVPPTPTGFLLAARPVLILDMWQVVADLRFCRVDLIPLIDTRVRLRVRLSSDRRRNLDRIGHRSLNDAPRFGLRADS